jgi:hypothetical protein
VPDNLKDWIEVVRNVLLVVAGLITAIWAYSKYIVERGLLPSAQFEIELGTVGSQQGKQVFEILLHLKNLGTSTLIIKNLRIDIRYIDRDAPADLFGVDDIKVGRLKFTNALFEKPKKTSIQSIEDKVHPDNQPRKKEHFEGEEVRGVPIIKHNTFVQPNVDQTYTFGTAVPASTSYILVWSSFEYEPRPSLFQRPILSLSRRLGLIQYTLKHVREPHSCERIFKLNGTESDAT